VQKHQPLRTCLATGQKLPQRQLLRFVNMQGVPTPDPAQKLPGRGAYRLVTEQNLALAIKKKAFAHKLKTHLAPPTWGQISALLVKAPSPSSIL